MRWNQRLRRFVSGIWLAAIAHCAQAALPAPWTSADIGTVGVTGASAAANGVFTIKGSGANIWDAADAFQFVYQPLSGDGSITAHLVSQTRTNNYAKAGVMIRATLEAGAANAAVLLTPTPGAVLQGRLATGASTAHLWGPSVTAPYWIRLIRAGNVFTGYTSLDGSTWKTIGHYTIPMSVQVYVGLAVTSHNNAALSTAVLDNVTGPGTSPSVCNPVAFGAIGNGTTDNTTAIQNAVDSCAGQGGGIVELGVGGGKSIYLAGPIRLKSHVQLQIDKGVVLQGTNDHSRYVGAYINWPYQPNEALVSASGATDVGITGAGTIDGAGGQLQPNGSPSWWTLHSTTRPYILEFYQCSQVTISGITLRNAPFWNQSLRFSNDITETGVTITAPTTGAPNTDGVDLVGSTNVTLSGLKISVGDDDIAIKSGLPIDPADPKQKNLPRLATSQVQVSDITVTGGRGIIIGSEAANGVHDVTIQNVHMSGASAGFRIKGARDRSSNIYAITVKDVVMSGVGRPIILADYYPDIDAPVEPPYQPAAPVTATTPFVHDITIQNLNATGAFGQSIIEGLPESCMQKITLSGVSIQTKSQSQYLGLGLRHMTGTFTNVTSMPGAPNPPFVVQENVKVVSAGTTPPIAATAPQARQTACSAQ